MTDKTGAGAEKPLNGYVCFYEGKRVEVWASDMFEAKRKAVQMLKPPRSKQHMVSVTLAVKAGEQVVHTPDF